MKQENSWEEMAAEWRRDVPGSDAPHGQTLAQVQRSSRHLLWLAIVLGATAVAAVTSLTALAVLHGGLLSYTFAVIGWSAFLPIAGYLLVHRKGIAADSLDSLSMLESLLLKQRAMRDLLEFTRVLLGVETIISCAFWLMSQFRTHAPHWYGGIAIGMVGVLLISLVAWQRRKTERTIRSLDDLRATLSENGGANEGDPPPHLPSISS